MTFILGFIFGLFTFIGYLAFRALRSGHWDDSNLLNVLRLISFVATHPEVFPYLVDSRKLSDDAAQWLTGDRELWPFWYLPHDEFKEVVTTIPDKDDD